MLCKRCNKNEKVGYKYCKECKAIAKYENGVRGQAKRRGANLTLCKECNKIFTFTKYCNECAVIVKKKKLKKKQLEETALGQKLKAEKKINKIIGKKEKINPKWLRRK